MKPQDCKVKISIQDFNEKDFKIQNGIYVHKNVQQMNKPIFRYMRFEYLLSMLKKQELYIPNRLAFPDLREHGHKEDLRYLFSLQPVPHNKKEKAKNEEEFQKRKAMYNICVSCWTYDTHQHASNPEIHEDYLMWKAYAYQEIGCRIESNLQDLVDCIKLPESKEEIIIADVKYEKESWDSAFTSVFKKSPYYFNEQEVRLCVLSQEAYVKLPINPMKLIKEITFSPFVDPDYADFYINQTSAMYPELEGKMIKSHIFEYPKI